MINKVAPALVGGLLVFLLVAIVAGFGGVSGENALAAYSFTGSGLAVVLALSALNHRIAWRRILLLSGCLCLVFPIAALLNIGPDILDTEISVNAGESNGPTISSIIVFCAAVFFGAVAIAAGLLIGRKSHGLN